MGNLFTSFRGNYLAVFFLTFQIMFIILQLICVHNGTWWILTIYLLGVEEVKCFIILWRGRWLKSRSNNFIIFSWEIVTQWCIRFVQDSLYYYLRIGITYFSHYDLVRRKLLKIDIKTDFVFLFFFSSAWRILFNFNIWQEGAIVIV